MGERADHLRDVDAVAEMSRADLELHAKALGTIHAITDCLFASTDEEGLERALEAISRSTRFPGVAVFALDEPMQRLELVCGRGFSEATLRAAQYLPLEGSASGLAIRTRRLQSTDVVATDPRIAPHVREPLAEEGFLAAACVPLLLGDRALGVMNLIYKGDLGLSPRERDLLSSIGSVIAVALERRRAHAERDRAERMMREAQKMEAMGRLAGGIAHDFNNMLAPITIYVSLLRQGRASDDPVNTGLVEIELAVERAAALTRQLLAFSRRQAVVPRALDPNAVVTDIEQMLRRVVGPDVAIEIRLASDVGHVVADTSQLDQVIVNLVVNARDAMPAGGRLSIETARVTLESSDVAGHIGMAAGEYISLSVTDTGTGMPPETVTRIFEPFFTTKEPSKGTGLGLSTVYGIIKQFGGDVWVESEVGKGTTFRVFLPRRLDTEETEAIPDSARVRVVRARAAETALLVEDDDDVRRATRTILEQAGFTVIEARTAPEGLLEWTRDPAAISIVVTDVVMPGMSGRELRDRMRRTQPTVKVLLMSGYPVDDRGVARPFEPGTAFLEKPFTPDALVRKVREVLDE